MLDLHYAPGNANLAPHMLLHALDLPHRLVLVDRGSDAHKGPAYLALNPNGLIPVLVDGDLVLYETAAICLHLCDTHPASGLVPALGTPERAHFYKWLMWLTNTLQATLIVYFYPERWVNAGNMAGAAEVKHHAGIRINNLLKQLDNELTRHGGPWFMGEAYTALDPYVFTLCRWTRNFAGAPARSKRQLGPYLQRMLDRPAVQRVLANEGLSPPFV